MNYQKLSKKALTCMYVSEGISFLIGMIIMGVLIAVFHQEWPTFVTGIMLGVAGVSFLMCLIVPKVRYERYRYILTQEELEVRKGLIVIKTEIVPIERLHKIEVSSGPILRAFGLKDVLATTAGNNIKLEFLTDEVAEQIAMHLKKRINTIAVEERVAVEENVNAGQEEEHEG